MSGGAETARGVQATKGVQARDAALDVIKGLAIICVPLVHVWRGAEAAGLITDPLLYRVFDTFFCMWVLTVFAFVAGLFIERGMRRDGAGMYARRRILEFAWLYVVWSLLNNLSNLVGSKLANTPVTLEQSLALWAPRAQMWYLGWIALMVALAAVARPWESRARSVVALSIAAAGTVACWGLNGPVLGTLGLGISLAFFLGVWTRSDRALVLLRNVPTWTHVTLGVIAVCFSVGVITLIEITPPTYGGTGRTIATVALGMTIALVSSVGMMQLGTAIARTRLRTPLANLGATSMVIFLGHLLFTPTVRILLMQVGVTDLAVNVLVGTVAGIVGPLLMMQLARRWRMSWLFAAPGWLMRWADRTRARTAMGAPVSA